MHFLHFCLPFFIFFLHLTLFLSSCLLSIQSCSCAVPPTPTHHPSPPHTHCVPFLFFLTNLLLICVYIPPSHSFNSVSLSVLSEGLSWKRLPPTHSLFSLTSDLHSQWASAAFHMLPSTWLHTQTCEHAKWSVAHVNTCACNVLCCMRYARFCFLCVHDGIISR